MEFWKKYGDTILDRFLAKTEQVQRKIFDFWDEIVMIILYRGSSPYANFITVNIITVIFQNIL